MHTLCKTFELYAKFMPRTAFTRTALSAESDRCPTTVSSITEGITWWYALHI